MYDRTARTRTRLVGLTSKTEVNAVTSCVSTALFSPFGNSSKQSWPQALKPETYNSISRDHGHMNKHGRRVLEQIAFFAVGVCWLLYLGTPADASLAANPEVNAA